MSQLRRPYLPTRKTFCFANHVSTTLGSHSLYVPRHVSIPLAELQLRTIFKYITTTPCGFIRYRQATRRTLQYNCTVAPLALSNAGASHSWCLPRMFARDSYTTLMLLIKHPFLQWPRARLTRLIHSEYRRFNYNYDCGNCATMCLWHNLSTVWMSQAEWLNVEGEWCMTDKTFKQWQYFSI